MSFEFRPLSADQFTVAYGVNDVMAANSSLSGWIIQNEDIADSVQNLEIPDQKGRTCQVIAYDKGKTISLTMIGSADPPCKVGDQLTIENGTITVTTAPDGTVPGGYLVQNVRRTCTYNDTAKWVIDGQGWQHARFYDRTEAQL